MAAQVVRQNLRGTKNEDWCNWPAQDLNDMDSTLAVQQYIQQIIRRERTNVSKLLEVPEGQDEAVWQYEHLRQFCMELDELTVMLQDKCTPETCPKMNVTQDWMFLCAAHGATPLEVCVCEPCNRLPTR
eukprot:Colp12_sorted_trinity150504_noHs@15523